MAFTLFKKKEKKDINEIPDAKNKIIKSIIVQAKLLQDHCYALRNGPLDQYDKSTEIDYNIQEQIDEFSKIWVKLYNITKDVVNKILEDKLKSEGADILTYMSQNLKFNTQNPTILIGELEKREKLLTKIIEKLTLLLNK